MSKISQITESLNQLDTLALLAMAEKIAKDEFDGHLSIMKFTTHYKAMFDTPNLYSGIKINCGVVDQEYGGLGEVSRLKPAKTFREVLLNLILDHDK